MAYTIGQAAAQLCAAGKEVKRGKLRRLTPPEYEESPSEYVERAIDLLRAGWILWSALGSKKALWEDLGVGSRTMMPDYVGGRLKSPRCARVLIDAGVVDICPCGAVNCEGCGGSP